MGLTNPFGIKSQVAADNYWNEGAKQGLAAQGRYSQGFGDQGAANYNAMTGQLGGTYGQLGDALNYQRGLMMGQNSVSQEQLRQNLQQGLAAQQSMAAGASPQNAAMAATNAAINMGRLSAGLAGQQALAGLQERNMAAQNYGQLGSALGQLQLGQRGQDQNVALGGYQQSLAANQAILQGPGQQNRLQAAAPLFTGLGGALMGARGGA